MNKKTPARRKLDELENAAKHLVFAAEALERARDIGGFYSTDAYDIARQVRQVLSCDDGEAGLESLIEFLRMQQ